MTHELDIGTLIRAVPDFPKPGVLFRDITTLLRDAAGFRAVVEKLGAEYGDSRVDKIAAIESRGFIIGAALAFRMQAGFVPIRKGGKLPAENFGQDYQLEYGSDRLEVHRDGIQPGERVLLVDDLIATGGTAEAALGVDQDCGRVHCRLRLCHRFAGSGRSRTSREYGLSGAGAVPFPRPLMEVAADVAR